MRRLAITRAVAATSAPMPSQVDIGDGSAPGPALLRRFSESALAQGRNYLITEGVFNGRLTRTPNGMILEADVRRSPARHYHVVITCVYQGECAWECNCPFAAQNCEHAAAVLQGWLQNPQSFSMADSDMPIIATVPASPVVNTAPVTADPKPRLAAAPEPPHPGRSPLRISSDLMLHIRHDEASASLRRLVDAFGESRIGSSGQGSLRLTGMGLQNALESGLTLEEIESILTEANGEPLPEAVRERLQAWAAAYDNFHLYDHLSVVEFADDFVLQELLRGGGIRRYLLHIFSPRLAAIHPRHVNDLVAEMERRGFMPKVEP